MTWSGEIRPTGTMLSAATITVSAAIAITGLKFRAGQRVGEVAEVIGQEGIDQREVGPQRGLHQVVLAGHRDLLLAFLDHRADAGGGEDAAEAEAAGADAFDQRALRHQVDLHLAGDHLRLGLGVQADVADDRLLHQAGADQLADAHAGHRGVVGDHGEIALALAHQFVDHVLRGAHGHEAADHQAGAVGDQCHRIGKGESSHRVSLN